MRAATRKPLSVFAKMALAIMLALVATLALPAVQPTQQAHAVAAKPTVTVKRAATGKLVMKKGSSYKLAAKASAGKLSYKSSKPKTVSVTKAGVLKAKKTGKATIKVKAKFNGRTSTKNVTVTVVSGSKFKKVKKVGVKLGKSTLTAGSTTKARISFSPKAPSNKNVTFKSSNTKVASVSAAGKVTAKAAGTAKITVTSCDNAKAKKTVKLKVKRRSKSGLAADCAYVPQGKATSVVFTYKAGKGNSGIALYSSEGKKTKKIAAMSDNGKGNDLVAGDGIFTCTASVKLDSAAKRVYIAKSGALQSNKVTVRAFQESSLKKSISISQDIDATLTAEENQVAAASSDKAAAAKSAYERMISYLDGLRKNGKIKSYTQDNGTITVSLPYYTYVFEFNPVDGVQAPASPSATLPESPKGTATPANPGDTTTPAIPAIPTGSANAAMSTMASTLVSGSGDMLFVQAADTGGNNILTAQPYASELSSPVFDDAATAVQKASIGYTFKRNVDNSAVSIDFMKSLSGYKLIIWDGHGGYSSTLHSFLGTGESSDGASSKYAADMANNRIIGLSGGRLGVTSRFFTRYYADSGLSNCLVYLGCCHGLEDDVLASALRSVGAKTVLGFKYTVYSTYNRNVCGAFIRALAKKDSSTGKTITAQKAYNQAVQAYGDKDPEGMPSWWDKTRANLGWQDQKKPAEFKLSGSTSFRLVSKADGEDALKAKLKERTSQPVLYSFYDDFDGDSSNEAFVVTGEKWDNDYWYRNASIWFVNSDGAQLLESDAHGYTTAAPLSASGYKFAVFESSSMGSGSTSSVYGVKGGKPVKMTYSGSAKWTGSSSTLTWSDGDLMGFDQGSNGNFTATVSGCFVNGYHQYPTMTFRFDKTAFKFVLSSYESV